MLSAAAMSLLGIDAAKIGNMWYLSNNPAVANFDTGEAPMRPTFYHLPVQLYSMCEGL